MCLMKIFPVLKVFISSKNLSFICYARLCAGYFYIKSSPKENFPIKQKKNATAFFKSERAGVRTRDNLIKSQVLYQLSYTPI